MIEQIIDNSMVDYIPYILGCHKINVTILSKITKKIENS